ncbi:prepilin-type N-terminal cleavage/methylation domain-containing protein [Jeotgalibaca porci]|uniref:prepilin-type N-terminal cleavage/methylation domain-containing protein n=3 Tax=Jeotgalibaca porci TaxID=1868793 RepID=UPI0016B6F91B|nr:prepilin-type N-terminal cleavage/methylation domain-containing protein [Lactobacillales bacterium]
MGNFCAMKQAGFTLFESIVVLLITSIIMLVSAQVQTVQTANYELRYFMKELTSEIEQAQNTAVITGKSFVVERKIKDQRISYSFTQEGKPPSVVQQPASVTGPLINSFWIKGYSGYIQPDTLIFYNENIRMRLSFQFGWGRFELEETKK